MVLDEDEFYVLLIVVDEGEGEHEEGVELDWLVLALGAIHDGFILAVEVINYDGLISLEESLPSLSSYNFIRPAIIVFGLDVGLFLHSIQIFV